MDDPRLKRLQEALEGSAADTDPCRDVASDLAAGGWEDARRALLARLVHDLRGRATALQGVTELLREAGCAPPELGLLETEARRVEEAAADLGLVNASPCADAEPRTPADLVGAAARLLRRYRGLEDLEVEVDIDPDAPPVRVGVARITAVLITLAGRLGLRALESGRRHLTVRAGVDDGDGGLLIEMTADGATHAGDDGDRNALGRVAALDGGRIEEGGPATYRLRLPPLRRGAGGSG